MTTGYSLTTARFTGWANLYNQHRAAPPQALANTLCRYANIAVPDLVVDLGSGTGLSTRYWSDKAKNVIGIEPTADMRREAELAKHGANVSYRHGYSHETALPDGCADLVVCMQALHWMDPDGTFAEAKRILRPGGVFAACDYEWPPSVGSAESERAFEACMALGRKIERELGIADGLPFWEKAGHLSRMRASTRFRYVRELGLNHTDTGNARRFVGVLLSQGYVQQALRRGVPEEDLGIPEFRRIADEALGDRSRPWLWTARLWIGVT
jgi:SAM-dependent methyltransferase